MSDMDDEESFLVPLETENSQKEKVWCQIDEKGELAYVDWEMIDNLAKQFDAINPENRTEQMLIGKLMWLVRKKTKEELRHDD